MTLRSLRNATVVVVGASSGIGRATARAFAAEGANLVVAARRDDMLRDVVDECRRTGGRAVAVRTDVTDPGALRYLVDAAIDAFGGIDVWINNAGVGAVGWFEEVPLAAHRRVLETNLLGALHGTHAVIPHFIDRRRGVLINTASIGSWMAPPLAVSYTAAKFGLRGLTEALRQDMRRFPGIQVAAVYPAFVDTPGLRHFGNYTGLKLDMAMPMQRPETVAQVMVEVARNPRGTAPVGILPLLGRIAFALAPDLVGAAMFHGVRFALARAEPGPDDPGNLFGPPPDRLTTRGQKGPSPLGSSRLGRSLPRRGPKTGRGPAAGIGRGLGIVTAAGAIGLAALVIAAGTRRT